MADFSLTTLFVAPVGQTALPSSGSTQDLTAGQIGIFNNVYATTAAGGMATTPYFYVAQGRENTYLQGSKRSDKVAGALNSALRKNVTEWYKVTGSAVASNQIIEISNWSVLPGQDVSLTLRGHSSYVDTLYYNGFTRTVTVKGACLDCGADPCVEVDVPQLIDDIIEKLNASVPGNNPDNISFSTFYTYQRIGDDQAAVLRIEGKPLTKYGVPCDIAANSHEYDRFWFRAFPFIGPDTTSDFYVDDSCSIIAETAIIQEAGYASGTYEEIKQLEINYYSYQAGYLKHLYRMAGYNQNFEPIAVPGTVYDTYYVKFIDYDASQRTWGDYIPVDSMIIIAVPTGSAFATALEAVLVAGLGAVTADNTVYTTTTTTTV